MFCDVNVFVEPTLLTMQVLLADHILRHFSSSYGMFCLLFKIFEKHWALNFNAIAVFRSLDRAIVHLKPLSEVHAALIYTHHSNHGGISTFQFKGR